MEERFRSKADELFTLAKATRESIASLKVARVQREIQGENKGEIIDLPGAVIDITGDWLMTDVKTESTFKCSFSHSPGSQTFTGKHLGIGAVREGRLNRNDISWRVGNVRYSGTTADGKRLTGGEYLGPDGTRCNFIGVKQVGLVTPSSENGKTKFTMTVEEEPEKGTSNGNKLALTIQTKSVEDAPRRQTSATLSPKDAAKMRRASALKEPLLGGKGRKESNMSSPRASPPSACLFPDPASIKKRVLKQHYDVEKLYHETGMCQQIARSHTFEHMTFVVIILNSIWIGIVTDYNHADILVHAPSWVQIFENLFCFYFTFELTIRFLSFRQKLDAFTDSWFCFDCFLVVCMVYETWVITALYVAFGGFSTGRGFGNVTVMRIFRLSRLTRLTRIARVGRLLRQIPQLNILCKALSLAVSSVGATLVLMAIGIYIFAIFFVETLRGTEEGNEQFANVPLGMHTLLVYGILADHRELVNAMVGTGAIHYVAILLYMFVVAMTMTDMLIGVISEIIGSVAEIEKEAMIKENVSHKMQEIRKKVDMDDSGSISKAEFAEMLANDSILNLMDELAVDTIALVTCAEVIFDKNCEEIGLEEFLEILLGFRESTASVKEMCQTKKFMMDEFVEVKAALAKAVQAKAEL